MTMDTVSFVLTVIIQCAVVSGAHLDPVGLDVLVKFGNINETTIRAATAEAVTYLKQSRSVDVIFAAGVYVITTTDYPFELTSITPSAGERLRFMGAGIDSTTLKFDGNFDVINGRNVSRVTFQDMTFARTKLTVTQGIVTSASLDQVTLAIQQGYPSPSDIMGDPSRLKPGAGRFLRRYRNNNGDCELIAQATPTWPEVENTQVKWLNATHVATNVDGVDVQTWMFTGLQRRFANHTEPVYTPGDLVGVKSKHGGQAYFMDGGDDIAFLRVRWTEHSRGVLRGGISNIVFRDTRIDRSPMAPTSSSTSPSSSTSSSSSSSLSSSSSSSSSSSLSSSSSPLVGACLSTPGGGPQIGQPGDPLIYNVTVLNHTATGTGDDSVALFNVGSGSVIGCHIRDSFARGILLDHSANTKLANNNLTRCPVYITDHL